MIKKYLFALFFISQISLADPGIVYTNGLQSNPSVNTVLATTGTLECRGNIGCNYIAGLILHSSNARTFALQALNESQQVVSTLTFSVQEGDTKIFDIPSAYFIPNGYSLRVVNTTGALLGSSTQAVISLAVKEIN